MFINLLIIGSTSDFYENGGFILLYMKDILITE